MALTNNDMQSFEIVSQKARDTIMILYTALIAYEALVLRYPTQILNAADYQYFTNTRHKLCDTIRSQATAFRQFTAEMNNYYQNSKL